MTRREVPARPYRQGTVSAPVSPPYQNQQYQHQQHQHQQPPRQSEPGHGGPGHGGPESYGGGGILRPDHYGGGGGGGGGAPHSAYGAATHGHGRACNLLPFNSSNAF